VLLEEGLHRVVARVEAADEFLNQFGGGGSLGRRRRETAKGKKESGESKHEHRIGKACEELMKGREWLQ
jgi:hypothetical protein